VSQFDTKMCFLDLAGKISKLMFVMDHDVFCGVMDFLTDVKRDSKTVPAVEMEESRSEDGVGFGQRSEPVTVSSEAWWSRHLFLKPAT